MKRNTKPIENNDTRETTTQQHSQRVKQENRPTEKGSAYRCNAVKEHERNLEKIQMEINLASSTVGIMRFNLLNNRE